MMKNPHIEDKREPEKETWQRFSPTERDWRILEHLYQLGFLSERQVARLEFGGEHNLRHTKERMGGWFHNGYINKTSRMGTAANGDVLYWLTRSGAREVTAHLGLPFGKKSRVRSPRLPGNNQHNVVENDVIIDLMLACEQYDELKIVTWIAERTLRREPVKVSFLDQTNRRQERGVVPDSIFVIQRQYREDDIPFYSRLLLEIDMSTHSTVKFADEKLRAGTAYIRSNLYQQQFRFPSEKNIIGGRWLVVCKTLQRLENLKLLAERILGKDARIWYFALMSEITVNSILFEPIWYRANSEDRFPLFKHS